MRNNQDEWIVEDIVDNNTSSKKSLNGSRKDDESSGSQILSKKGKKSKRSILQQRSEPSLNISEFNITEVGKEKIRINDLVKATLKTTGKVTHKNLQTVKKLKKLNVPLSKQQQQRIRNALAQEKTSEEVAKWDSLIQTNRTAEQLVFPLQKPVLPENAIDQNVNNFKIKHPVEEAVSELLSTSENVLTKDKVLTDAEEKALKAMSAAEAKLRHDELMRHRALISRQEAKARYQNKIKSKSYHRLLKKEKLKKAMKEFEELRLTDEAKALEKFAELDKLRILERMTLKHRNTGKWAKQQRIHAKYNPESRSVLKEDLQIGKQLRAKVDGQQNASDVPKGGSLHSYARIHPSTDNIGLIEGEQSEDEENENMRGITQMEDSLLEAYGRALSETQESDKSKGKSKPKRKDTVNDMADFVSKEQCLDSAVPKGVSFGNEDLDEVMGDIMPMSEAFGDEECIEEFKAEKEAHKKANEVQGIDLYLPGWGSWAGPGIKPDEKKMKRFFIKAPSPPPQKHDMGHVILNPKRDEKASALQVSALPYPFNNVHQFESYIRQPIGHTWNPQKSFRNLVAPKVVTKMGRIIEPMDADDVELNKKRPKQPIRNRKQEGEISAF